MADSQKKGHDTLQEKLDFHRMLDEQKIACIKGNRSLFLPILKAAEESGEILSDADEVIMAAIDAYPIFLVFNTFMIPDHLQLKVIKIVFEKLALLEKKFSGFWDGEVKSGRGRSAVYDSLSSSYSRLVQKLRPKLTNNDAISHFDELVFFLKLTELPSTRAHECLKPTPKNGCSRLIMKKANSRDK